MKKKIRLLGFVLTMLVIATVAVLGVRSLIISSKPKEVLGYKSWNERVVAEMQSLPVQDGGRVKPYQTLARRYMYAMHGDRTMEILIGGKKKKITATEWLIDVMFRPEEADKLPTFRIDNSAILEQVGMEVKSLRDRYSFDQIRPYLSKMQLVYEEAADQQKKLGVESLSIKQKQSISFMKLLQKYDSLKNVFSLNAVDPKFESYKDFKSFFESNKQWFEQIKLLGDDKLNLIKSINNKILSDAKLLLSIKHFGGYSEIVLNPTVGEKEWKSIGRRFAEVANINYMAADRFYKQFVELENKHGKLSSENVDVIYSEYFVPFKEYMVSSKPYSEGLESEILELEKLQLSFTNGNAGEQLDTIQVFKKKYENHVSFGEEGGDINGEIWLNNMSYFNNGIAILLLAGILLIAMCLCLGTKSARILYWVVYGLVGIACLLTIVGIFHRSYIMDRSPIGTLYDTIVFIVATGLILLLLIELIHKRAVMLGVAIIFGVVILFLAKSYEASEARDQLDPLVAVLKSNYWLSTHVVIITLGYMGGIVAACISHFYIIGRVFGIIDDGESRKYLTKIVYGMIAFTLLFSLVGTILGGIWAADSWGRFWGWDPKENGALMIVLWMLIVLHARLGGYIREIGLHVCSVFGFMVVVFSWWHVNFLGVGLHNYGFTSATAMTTIWIFYAMEFFIMLMGMTMAYFVLDKKRKQKLDKELEKLAAEGTA